MTHACIIVHRMAHRNCLINCYFIPSFVKLMVLKSLKSLTRNVMNFTHLLGYDTIVTTVEVFSLLAVVTSRTVATYVIFHFT